MPERVMVAVDFTAQGELTEPTQLAVEEALNWADHWGASVCFAHFLEVSDRLWKTMQADKESSIGSFFHASQQTLENLVSVSQARGIEASSTLARGKAWVELIQLAHREGHQMVFAGVTGEASLARALFGGTTRKLVRKCASLVWIVKEGLATAQGCVLLPHDLEETGEVCVRHAVDIATALHAPLKILHALDLPEFNRFMAAVPSARLSQEKQSARDEIERQLKQHGYQGDYEILLEVGPPAATILRFLREQTVRLVVMGSVARSGIPGLIVGNTAETILPWTQCSVLVAKPEGFVSPVLENSPGR